MEKITSRRFAMAGSGSVQITRTTFPCYTLNSAAFPSYRLKKSPLASMLRDKNSKRTRSSFLTVDTVQVQLSFDGYVLGYPGDWIVTEDPISTYVTLLSQAWPELNPVDEESPVEAAMLLDSWL
mgnify:CR=1 FL=1